jgi:hypothetical protein
VVQGPFKKKICEWRGDSLCEACLFAGRDWDMFV